MFIVQVLAHERTKEIIVVGLTSVLNYMYLTLNIELDFIK